MRRIDLRGCHLTVAELLAAVPRAHEALRSAADVAAALVTDVSERGERALREQASQFDGVEDHAIAVPPAHLKEASASLDPALRRALERAIAHVREASAAQVPTAVTTEMGDGASIVQRWQPVQRAGVYIPGGKAVYPSSAVMNIVPAQVAGVGEIALASPPQAGHHGRVHPTILAVADLLGITEVYAIGGAGAIGAFAHGVADFGLDPVDVVTGPGNNYVAAAKRAVAGIVGTDAEAGATEILVVADADADAVYVAADLVSQAEHDEQASAVLVTDSAELADRVAAALPALVAQTKHADRVAVALGGEQSAIVLVDSLAEAARFSNAYAPEHLELHVANAAEAASEFTSAGAIFVGADAPVSLGDYLAGSNHVLPTGGQARYASGLGAFTFLRPQQVIEYDRAALARVADDLVRLAEAEDLPAHGEAVTVRLTDEQPDS